MYVTVTELYYDNGIVLPYDDRNALLMALNYGN